MSNYYVMLLDSLESDFALLSGSQTIKLRYLSQIGFDIRDGLEVNDKIVGYYRFPDEKASVVFEVVETKGGLKVKKVLETDKGCRLNPELKAELIEKTIVEIDESLYIRIIQQMLEGYAVKKIPKVLSNNKDYNVLLYGIPGSGKSYTIKRDYCDDEEYMERVVFHPDYSYTDFIGQILPDLYEDANGDKHVYYNFFPGPFTRLLKKAINDKENNYYLIIEEINRGNAPAIFGDVFQLLDRKTEKDLSSLFDEAGESVYGITNHDIAREVYGNPDLLVVIPSNMYIIASMNTSDQNVFTLDTAFKRRWQMKSIKNNMDDCEYADVKICGSDVSWKRFVEVINKRITDMNEDMMSNEDKRIGAFFLNEKEVRDPNKFCEKILMYLWNDVFKFQRKTIFSGEFKSLEDLINGFNEKQFEIFNKNEISFDNEE